MVYALLGKPNTPGFIWWALLAALACGLPLAATRYDALSFISIWALIHALYFPFAVWLNLIASQPGVYEVYLWDATPAAMLVMTLGMAGLALGSKITDSIWPLNIKGMTQSAIVAEKEIMAVSPKILLCLVSMVIPLALFDLATNNYYHALALGASEWSEESALAFGFMGYFEYVICAAILVQLRRYYISRSRRDLAFALIIALLPVLVYLPGGSRDKILRTSMYPLLVAMMGFPKHYQKKILLFGAGLFLGISFLLLAIETYRGTIYYEMRDSDLTLSERTEIIARSMTNTIIFLEEKTDVALQLYGRRFADYVMVGRITDAFPSELKYRGLKDLEYWPIFILPNPLRPSTTFDARDSAALSESVKRGFHSGSSPAMVLGDLYSRFSWLGVFLGMTLVGFILRWLDKRLSRFGLFETLLYGVLLVPIVKMPHDSMLAFFLFLTRNMLIALLIVAILKKVLSIHRRRGVESLAIPVLSGIPGKQFGK